MKEIVKYNAPEFEEGKGVQELLKYEAPLDGLIQINTKNNSMIYIGKKQNYVLPF